jgi:adenylate cyclase
MKRSSLLLLLLVVFINSFAGTNLDSLWKVWEDSSQPDSVRLKAIGKYAWNGYLWTEPDSAFYFSQLQLDFAKEVNDLEWQATALNTQGASFYVKGENEQAVVYYKMSLAIQEEIGDKQGIASCLGNIGVIYEIQGDHANAIENYNKCLKIMEDLKDSTGIANVLNNIGVVYDLQKEYDKAIEHYERCLSIQEGMKNKQGISVALNNLGGIFATQGNHSKAIEYYNRSVEIQEEIGNNKGVANTLSNIGVSYKELENYDKAFEYLNRSLAIERGLKNKKGLANTLNNLGSLHQQLNHTQKAIELSTQALRLAQEIGAAVHTRDAARVLYRTYSYIGQSKKALEMHELYIEMRDSVLSEENQRELIRQEFKYEYEKEHLLDSLNFAKKEELNHLELQKRDAELSKQRVALFSAAGGLVLLVLLAFAIYRGKKRSDELLLNILPEETAAELKSKGHSDAKFIDHVTVLFTDVKGFTSLSEKLGPKELVEDINECFSAYDGIMEKYGVEKIKTIGDSYMAAGGLPTPNQSHGLDVINAALEIQEFMADLSAKRKEIGKPVFEIRIGVHTGPVVAGIVGIKKFQYDIWGDTVNSASRMETHGEVGRVNISQATYDILKDVPDLTFTERGYLDTKGKGKMSMYFVNRV